ncbi:hypothetical protein ScPMuIL_003765 [Solemya velum]
MCDSKASPSSITLRCCAPGNTATCQNTNVDDTTVSATTTQKPTTAIPNPITEKPVVTTDNKPIDNTIATPTDKSATTTGIQDKTSTPTLGHTSSGQNCKQTEAREQFPVEIVVPVVVITVVFCVATVAGSVIYVRRHTNSKQDPTYDRHANTPAQDIHLYEDIRRTSDNL